MLVFYHPQLFIFMGFMQNIAAVLITAVAIHGTQADTLVSGTVFCDQCKDGQLSLFDFPLAGAKVTVACSENSSQIAVSTEETTNLLGNYGIRIKGTPDMSNCYAQVSGSDQSASGCNATKGPPQKLRLVLRMLDMAIYAVDTLRPQPSEPMAFCPRSLTPIPAPAPDIPIKSRPPFISHRRPRPPKISRPRVPRPQLPPIPTMPQLILTNASACPHQNWSMSEYKCYWRVVKPDAKVAVVFGSLAADRYGSVITLSKGLQGRGEPYRTLLREAKTAYLNSLNSLQFTYPTRTVVQRMNKALTGSLRLVLSTAFRFKRANNGVGKRSCSFTPCN